MSRAILAAILLLATAGAVRAQTLEDRLRSQLVSTTADLRQAQASQATLQAEKDAADKARDALKAKLASLESQLRAARHAPAPAAAPAELDAAKAETQHLAQVNSDIQAQLATAQVDNEKLGREVEALRRDRDQLTAAASAADTSLTACKAKNVQAITVAKEILAAYDRTSLVGVAVRKEPFTRLKRVQIEQIEQDFGDRLYDSRLDTQPRAKPAPAKPQPQ